MTRNPFAAVVLLVAFAPIASPAQNKGVPQAALSGKPVRVPMLRPSTGLLQPLPEYKPKSYHPMNLHKKKISGPTNVDKKMLGGDGKPQDMICSVQRISMKGAPPHLALKSLDKDKIWLGAFVQKAHIEPGSMRAVSIPSSRRKKVNITTSLPMQISTSMNPTLSAYNDKLALIRQKVDKSPLPAGEVVYAVTESVSQQVTALQVGLNYEGIGYEVNATGEFNSKVDRSKFTSAFVQIAFTMTADLEGHEPRDAFLLNPTDGDLTKVNGAAYVDSITYGRLIFLEMESNYTTELIKAALNASYMGASASASSTMKTVAENSAFKLYSNGGSSNRVLDAVKKMNLGVYLSESVKASELVPISFTLRDFDTQAYANTPVVGEYTETVCNENFLKVRRRVSYRVITADDGEDQEMKGWIRLDSKTVWAQGGGGEKVHKGATPQLFLDEEPLTVLSFKEDGEQDVLVLRAHLEDYDKSSANDLIGNWDWTIDLNSVAKEFKDKKVSIVTRKQYKKGGDARGEMIVEFLRK